MAFNGSRLCGNGFLWPTVSCPSSLSEQVQLKEKEKTLEHRFYSQFISLSLSSPHAYLIWVEGWSCNLAPECHRVHNHITKIKCIGNAKQMIKTLMCVLTEMLQIEIKNLKNTKNSNKSILVLSTNEHTTSCDFQFMNYFGWRCILSVIIT